MDRTTIIIALITVLVFGGIIWISRPDEQNGAASITSGAGGGVLSADEKNFDFGSISMAAGKVSRSFKIKNMSASPATIEKMYTSCMCTTAMLEIRGEKFGPYGMAGHGFIPSINKTINPNEEASVEVVFDPAAHGPAGVGKIQRVVTIEQDGEEPVEFEFTATVTP